jgi:hypothetical protein
MFARWLSWRLLLSLVFALAAVGCKTTPRQYWESLKGEGFPEWSETMGSGVRASASGAKPSGFFTDRRSEQIEKSLGGGF